MKRSNLLVTIIATAGLLISSTVQAQNVYNLLPESTMQITGTSTIHDWEVDVEEMNINVTLAGDLETGVVPSSVDFIQSLTLTVPVEKLESGKGGMNKKIYGALKEKDHPTITYRFTGGEIEADSSNEGAFTVNATGDLTIAGVTNTVTFPVQASFDESGNLNFSGSYSLNMKDYDVDPPTAIFGTIKAGEEVSIAFDVAIGTNVAVNN